MHYFEQSLKRDFPPATYRLRHIRLHTVPNFDVGGGCDPYFDVRLGDGKQMIFDFLKVRERTLAKAHSLTGRGLAAHRGASVAVEGKQTLVVVW